MCEPAHSINQFLLDGQHSTQFAQKVEALPMSRLRRVDAWNHFSVMGKGHSESITALGLRDDYYVNPEITHYEAFWWDRSVHIDGGSRQANKYGALDAAREYAMRTSIGDLKILRRFLESTIANTDRHISDYEYSCLDLFNLRGQDKMKNKLTSLGRKRNVQLKKEGLIKVVCGLTRNRDNLNDVWADDEFWTPPKKEVQYGVN